MNKLFTIILSLLKALGVKTKASPKPRPAVVTKPESNVAKPVVQPEQTPPPEPAPEHTPVQVQEPAQPATLEITPILMQTTLTLGNYDEEVAESDIKAILNLYHEDLIKEAGSGEVLNAAKSGKKMRHGDRFEWMDIKAVAGNPVKTLQAFLVRAGIMHPTSNMDGIFAYATQAGVRLFQEYVRVYENRNIIPNGNVDDATWKIMQEWQKAGKTAGNWPRGKQSEEYKKWMGMLNKAKEHYQQEPHPILDKVHERIDGFRESNQAVDTFKVQDWTFNEDDIHLIGIRRKEEEEGDRRKNDDLFVLLINGMVFKFWGSTDPNQDIGKRKNKAFLTEGQHKFRFGWHNINKESGRKLYQGLEPYSGGVLVFRDQGDKKLTEEDIEAGVEKAPNQSINIHWTGEGRGFSGTWSEGCQVIAGGSYIDPLGEEQDCSAFTDVRQSKLNGIDITKGAYNLFCDLLLVYPVKRVDYLLYSMGRDETFSVEDIAGPEGLAMFDKTLDDFNMDRGIA